jgi:hypothetical protein
MSSPKSTYQSKPAFSTSGKTTKNIRSVPPRPATAPSAGVFHFSSLATAKDAPESISLVDGGDISENKNVNASISDSKNTEESNTVNTLDNSSNDNNAITTETTIPSKPLRSEDMDIDDLLESISANVSRRKQEIIEDEKRVPISNRYLSDELAKVPGLASYLQHRRSVKSSYSRQEVVDEWSHGTVTRAELHQRYSNNY